MPSSLNIRASGLAEDQPTWSPAFRAQFRDLLVWRRDERHFRSDPVPARLLEGLLAAACLAPSVGNAQPWRFRQVRSPERREAIARIFASESEAAAQAYPDERAAAYRRLKLDGLREAPVHLAVFCQEEAPEGHGLGRRTMPETLRYSVVCAVHTLWLAARMQGLGVGWVSILDPLAVNAALDAPDDWTLVAYLCIGWPKAAHDRPELERRGWQGRLDPAVVLSEC